MTEEKQGGQLALVSRFEPAVIEADFPAMRARLDELLEPYRGLDRAGLAQMPERDIRTCRTDVRRIIKNVEDGRKGVKRDYNRALDEFEAQVKELLAPAREYDALLKDALDEKEAERKGQRDDALRQHYAEFAPYLVPVVSYEQLADQKWLNKGVSLKTAEAQLEQKVAKVAGDWESLKAQRGQLAMYDQTEREFFKTLDLGAALAWNAQEAEKQRRIDEMKAKVEPARAEVEPEPEPQPEPPAPEPEPAPQRPAQQTQQPDDGTVLVFEVRVPWPMVGKFVGTMRSLGLHGHKTGVDHE